MVEGEFDAIEVLNPGYSFGVVSGGGFGFIGNIGKKCDRAGMPARIAVRIGIDTDELEVRRFYTRFLFEFPPRRLLDGFANLDEPPGKRESALERREFTPDHEHPTRWRDDDTIGGEERSARRRHGYSIYVESGAMKTATSAGLLLYRNMAELQVLLAHPGGPYWQKKDAGAWTIPKGEIEVDEDPFAAALREFGEEMGFQPTGRALPLGAVRRPAEKWCKPGPSKQIGTPPNSSAIPSASNGRRVQGTPGNFKKSIVQLGSTWKQRAGKSLRAKPSFLTVSRRPWASLDFNAHLRRPAARLLRNGEVVTRC